MSSEFKRVGSRSASRWIGRSTHIPLGLVLAALMMGIASPAAAQFTSGSSGADGALSFACTPGQVIEWDPVLDSGLASRTDNTFHFTTIDIPANCVIRLTASMLGQTPVTWLAQGLVKIDGVIDLNGEQGHGGQVGSQRSPSVPGAGGFPGGLGQVGGVGMTTDGFGPGAGSASGSGAGHALDGGGNPGSSYGNVYLLPLIGGSGGGGKPESASFGGGGGAGGGAILIATDGTIELNGQIHALGGNAGTTANGIRSGGGSGGAVRLVADTVSGIGGIDVRGGLGGFSREGSLGRIRIESNTYSLTGPVVGSARTVALSGNTVLVSTVALPKVSITTIAGLSVPASPSGFFPPADVVINEPMTVVIGLEAENIPVGTVVDVEVHNESTGTQVFLSMPLAGTVALSTAFADTIVDPGFSVITVRASFVP